mmetsp:Transcript_28675/g.63382  ORF Transcript_28675/g.63382 Transcript_28675/m.63382 type:complete len:232 (+) Transcript_28675:1-696(+)
MAAASAMAERWQRHTTLTATFGAWRCAAEESQRLKREALFGALACQLDAARCTARIIETCCRRRWEEVLSARVFRAWNTAAASEHATLVALAFVGWRRLRQKASHEATVSSEVPIAGTTSSRRRRRASTSDCPWLGKPLASSDEVLEQHPPRGYPQRIAETEVEPTKRHLRGPERFFYDRSGYTGCARFGGPCIIDKENWPPNLRGAGTSPLANVDGRLPLAAKNQVSVAR